MLHKIALINENCQFIQRGIELLEQVDDSLYQNNSNPFFTSGVGKHFRHIIDHFSSFIKGIDSVVNYDDRERNHLIETNREYAISVMKELITQLNSIPNSKEWNTDVLNVKSNEGEINESDDSASQSSIKRELQFLISHTVHHYAIIAIILRIQGFEAPENFGIAPSTIAYMQSLQKSELSGQ